MEIRIGTSGWSYAPWKHIFYPDHLKSKEWLKHYACYFHTTEINNTFYMLPKKETLLYWEQTTPNDFLFSIKCWRAITHYQLLHDCEALLKQFLDCTIPLKNKHGPILFQLPYSFHYSYERLQQFITILPKEYCYCFEFRHPSWWQEDVYHLLHKHSIAFCVFEIGKLHSPLISTTDFIYIRLHGNEGRYVGYYDDKQLYSWYEWIMKEKKNAFIYFDNTARKDDAIENALRLQTLFHSPA